MALYSSDRSIHCHRVRFVLAEKGINVDIINVTDDDSAAADLAELNPYNETPTLVDRDLLLHNAGVINDYLYSQETPRCPGLSLQILPGTVYQALSVQSGLLPHG